MSQCDRCGSYAINHHCHGRDGNDKDLCDVCYWRKRAEHQPLTDERQGLTRQAALGQTGSHLKWPRIPLIKASIQRQADCSVMLRALEGVAEWLGEQRIHTDDGRIELMYHVLQELEGKY